MDASAAVRGGVLGGAADAVCAADAEPESVRGGGGDVRQGGHRVHAAGVPAAPARSSPHPRRRLRALRYIPLVDLVTLLLPLSPLFGNNMRSCEDNV